jgi:hypothetical protein
MGDDAAPWDVDPGTSRELVRFPPEPGVDSRIVGVSAALVAVLLIAALLLWLAR